LFLDTSFIIALEDADDQNHQKAIGYWKTFKKHPHRLVTTTYVFDETITFLRKRISHDKAVQVGKLLLLSPTVEIIHISADDFENGWKLFLKYHDKNFSFTDCLSFLIIEQKGIKDALTFDEHFKQMGIRMIPSHS
jgi:predicted nucleic acid-binding protein